MKPVYLISFDNYHYSAYVWCNWMNTDIFVTGEFSIDWDDDIPIVVLDNAYLGDHNSEVEISLISDTDEIIADAIELCGDPRWYEDRQSNLIDAMEYYYDR